MDLDIPMITPSWVAAFFSLATAAFGSDFILEAELIFGSFWGPAHCDFCKDYKGIENSSPELKVLSNVCLDKSTPSW